MKIAHILAQKPAATGSGIYLSETIREFARQGCDQALVAGIAPGESYSLPEGTRFYPVVFESADLPFPVVGMSDQMPYPATRYRDMTPDMVERFYEAFDAALDEVQRDFRPDLVICHHLYLLTAHAAGRDWRCPVYGVCHSTDLRQFERIPLEREAVAQGIRRLDGVLALTGAQARRIAVLLGVDPGRIAVIGTGYNDAVFKRDPSIAKRPHSLLYVGKIWRQKGVPNLMRAVDLLPAGYGDLHIDLVGGYSDRCEYEQIAAEASACSKDYVFRGVVAQPDLVDAYNAAEVFALPSFSEGLPLVVLEALACGCKVVVSDLPGIREWLDASAPEAPVVYVRPPATDAGGAADTADFPRFEAELARALDEAFRLDPGPWSVQHLSWRSVCDYMQTLS